MLRGFLYFNIDDKFASCRIIVSSSYTFQKVQVLARTYSVNRVSLNFVQNILFPYHTAWDNIFPSVVQNAFTHCQRINFHQPLSEALDVSHHPYFEINNVTASASLIGPSVRPLTCKQNIQ